MHVYSVPHKQVAGMELQFKLSSLNAVVHLVTQEMYIHVQTMAIQAHVHVPIIECTVASRTGVLCTVKVNVDLLNVTLQVDLHFSGYQRENVQLALGHLACHNSGILGHHSPEEKGQNWNRGSKDD